ncbi:hypothetical protein PAXRUDRAFT_180199, partial [Paxillus rubicundulus Ve08.2h10]
FSQQVWVFVTNEVLDSMDRVSEKKWKKVYDGAEEYAWAHCPKSKAALCAKAQTKPLGRAHCYESDSE